MKQTLGTKILGVTDRYYLPFRLPSDIYFSDIYVKTEYDFIGVDVAYAVYIRVLVYENENDYKEVGGNPAGSPLIIWEGWVRNTDSRDFIRIPINYVADLYNYSKYYITADYTNSYPGQLSIDVLYSDIVTQSTSNYIPSNNRGLLKYTCRLTSNNALGIMSLTVNIDAGEWFEIQYLELHTGGGVTDKVVDYHIGILQNSEISWAVSDGDHIYLDRRFFLEKLVGPLNDIGISANQFAVDDYLVIELAGYVRTANLPTFTFSGNGVKSAETIIIY